MIVCVSGSRGLVDDWGYRYVKLAIETTMREMNCEMSLLICGMADGADLFGLGWAKMHGVPWKPFYPDWNRYGRGAGHRRNREMAHASDLVIPIWDGESPGTRGMIDYCHELILPCKVFQFAYPLQMA